MKTVYQNKLFVSIFHEVCLFCCYLHDYDNTSRAQEGEWYSYIHENFPIFKIAHCYHCYLPPIWFIRGLVLRSLLYRSTIPEVFLRKGVLKICSKYTGEHLFLTTPSGGCFWLYVFISSWLLLYETESESPVFLLESMFKA